MNTSAPTDDFDDFDTFVLRGRDWVDSVPAPLVNGGLREIRLGVSSLEPGNADRANRGLVLRRAHRAYTESEDLPRVAALLADLMHHCKAFGIDFADELNSGADFFEMEGGSDGI